MRNGTKAATAASNVILVMLKSRPADAARAGIRWLGQEIVWSADIFGKIFVSVLLFRAVSQLTSHWLFPREVWNESDRIMKGFQGEADDPPPAGERPRLIYETAGWRFYRNSTQYQGQQWPCPLLKPEPCQICEWFVPSVEGKNYCAAVAKVATLSNPYFRDKDLYEIKDALIMQFGDRRRPNGNGAYADRPGCM